MDLIILNHGCKLRMNKPYKQILALISLIGCLLLLHAIVFAETDPPMDKNRDIFKLLEVSGLLEQMDYIKDEATNSYARVISITYPKVPDQFWDDFNKLAGKEEMKVLLDRVVADQAINYNVLHTILG